MTMTPSAREVSDEITIQINGQKIERVTETKFLGVILDHKLTFKSHIDYISNKIAKCIGIISKARRSLSIYSLRMLYMALFQPYLLYCVEIWGHTYASYTKKLSILQKCLVRIITFSRYDDDHTLPLFKSLKMLPFGEQYEYKVATLVFKSSQNALPYPFVDYFTPYMSLVCL